MKLNIERIKILMAEQMITNGELCRRINISRNYLWQCFKGKTTPRPITVGKIAKALNANVTDIIEDAAATVETE